jgi:hypothetical protein
MPTTVPTKPSIVPAWNTGLVNNTEPTSGKKILGWEVGEQPSSAFFNWYMNLQYQWQQWAEDICDELVIEKIDYFAEFTRATAFGVPPESSAFGATADSPRTYWNKSNNVNAQVAIDWLIGSADTGGMRAALTARDGGGGPFYDFTLRNLSIGTVDTTNIINIRYASPNTTTIDVNVTTTIDAPFYTAQTAEMVSLAVTNEIFPSGTVNLGKSSSGGAWEDSYVKKGRFQRGTFYSSNTVPVDATAIIDHNQNTSIVCAITQGSLTSTPAFSTNHWNVQTPSRSSPGVFFLTLDYPIEDDAIVLCSIVGTVSVGFSVVARVEASGTQIQVRTFSGASPADLPWSLIAIGRPRAGYVAPPTSLA